MYAVVASLKFSQDEQNRTTLGQLQFSVCKNIDSCYTFHFIDPTRITKCNLLLSSWFRTFCELRPEKF